MFFRRRLKPENARATIQTVITETSTRAQIIDTLARTIWGEARGESLSGKEAVACAILNRVKISQRRGAMWWGDDIESVCLKPFQFSCWNKDDPNYFKLHKVTTDDPQFGICHRIAQRAVNGLLNDITQGADHYHANSIAPKWALERVPVATIGHHIFYKLEN